ncbi:MAG TPA: hypothetical protein DDW55_15025 [Gammaproteobacteria bacterium]|nr:hypothetical protein [Gammaproteobacteria bacterium]
MASIKTSTTMASKTLNGRISIEPIVIPCVMYEPSAFTSDAGTLQTASRVAMNTSQIDIEVMNLTHIKPGMDSLVSIPIFFLSCCCQKDFPASNSSRKVLSRWEMIWNRS